jgi:hypothetical protein
MNRVLVLVLMLVSTMALADEAAVGYDARFARQQGMLAESIGDTAVAFVGSSKTRAQVAAETREAARLGLLRYGVLGPVQATAQQEQQIKLAGMRAANHGAASE